MLIELRVENHRSIRDEQALTMQAADDGDLSDPRPRKVAGFDGRLLPAAALYGANASGKSNVLSGLSSMCAAVIQSQRVWPPEGGVPRDPFAWGVNPSAPSTFEVTVLVAGVRYQYGFLVNDERIVEEWLYAWPRSHKQIWLERDGDQFKFGEHLIGENRSVEQVTRPNALFLSAAVQLKHQQLLPLYGWFRKLQTLNVRVRGSDIILVKLGLEAWFAQDLQLSPFPEDDLIDRRRASFVELLRAADVAIVDLKVEKSDDNSGPSRGGRDRPLRVLLRHRSDAEDAWLPLEEESQGTRTLYRMGNLVLDVLANGGVLLVDELEASLHPALAVEILRQFNDPTTNPRNAQILFTTHDTHLLGTMFGEPPLRRDQVWLTEKDPDGATCLYPLTDYKPQLAENIERGYLQGRYGAIPFLGNLVSVGKPADGE